MLFLILNGIHAHTFPEHVFLVRVDQWDAFLPFIFCHSSRKLDNSVQVELVLNSINQDSDHIWVMCTCKQSYTNGALKSKRFLFSGSFSETCSATFLDWSQKKEVLISVIGNVALSVNHFSQFILWQCSWTPRPSPFPPTWVQTESQQWISIKLFPSQPPTTCVHQCYTYTDSARVPHFWTSSSLQEGRVTCHLSPVRMVTAEGH